MKSPPKIMINDSLTRSFKVSNFQLLFLLHIYMVQQEGTLLEDLEVDKDSDILLVLQAESMGKTNLD